MPKKERPAPLAESIFEARLGTHHQDDKETDLLKQAIPVHNTFIQFAVQPDEDDREFAKKHLATAPAWVGPSFESIMRSAVPTSQVLEPDQDEPLQRLEGDDGEAEFVLDANGDRKLLGSPKKVPVMRYYASGAAPIGPSSAVAKDGAGSKSSSESAEVREAEKRPVALPPAGGSLPSMGSEKHHEGQCKRCCFFPKGRCQNGYDCEFCHFEHEKRKRKKKKKGGKRNGVGEEESESDEEWPGTAGSQVPSIAPGLAAAAAGASSAAAAALSMQHGAAAAAAAQEAFNMPGLWAEHQGYYDSVPAYDATAAAISAAASYGMHSGGYAGAISALYGDRYRNIAPVAVGMSPMPYDAYAAYGVNAPVIPAAPPVPLPPPVHAASNALGTPAPATVIPPPR